MTAIDAAVSRAARQAEDSAPGDGADAVVWEQVVRTTDADSALSVSYLAFLTIATLLAAIAIINDSAILTVGAMVLGPEFAPLAALAVAAVHGRPAGARRAAVTLVVGFARRHRRHRPQPPWSAGRWAGSAPNCSPPTVPRPGSSPRPTAGRWSSPCSPASPECSR